MLSLLLFGTALATCGLSADIDPNGACVTDANTFSTLDADSDSAIPISLEIISKSATTDAFGNAHGATAGSLADTTGTDGRYILACKQAAGEKTVQFNVNRPKALTAFGAEWVQLFPKDSWQNTTNEYEPFTFNDFGAKIALTDIRATPEGSTESEKIDVLNVFMEVKDEGDYEVMFGNPNLINSGNKWVAVQFKQTLLRVGTPWADCTGDVLATESYSVGAIAPILYGHPNLHSISLGKDSNGVNFPSYDTVVGELSGTTVDVKVVLEIFTDTITTYTSAADDTQCYKAGNACPEAHSVCKPEYCEMEVWAKIIADLKAASSSVSVLCSVGDGTSVEAYTAKSVACDGFYFAGSDQGLIDDELATLVAEPPAGYTTPITTVRGLGSPLFDEGAVDAATVYVTLSASDIGIWNPFSWYPYVSPSKWAAIVTGATDTTDIATLVDRGYGYVFLTSETGFDTASSLTPSVLTALATVAPGARRLQESRGLTASEPFWGCDDTLFECKPICMKQMGPVTTKVSDTLCAAAPLDQCSCKCLHAAQWTCEDDAVVCKARFGAGELKTVGDKVCETRGAEKPESAAELRVASQCEPVTEMRGSSPTAECLAQWGTPEPTTKAPTTEKPGTTERPPVPTVGTQAPGASTDPASTDSAPATPTEAATPSTATPTEAAEPVATAKPIIMAESFAAAMAFAALALHA